MTECQHHQTIIQNYVAGEISHSELESLHRHCQTCEGCRQLVDVHIGMTRAGREIPEPADADFRAMREGVMMQLARDAVGRAGRSTSQRIPWWDFRGLLRIYPAAGVVMGAVAIVCAVFAGRWSTGTPDFDDGVLLNEVYRQAAMAAGLDEYWDTPFSYANVSARPVAGGKLDLSFDVCRHVNVVTTMDSPVAKDVLLHAILSPSEMGTQMKAMALTQQVVDPRLKEAMVFTLHNDPSLAVRLQALSVISQYQYDPAVQDALLTTLRSDEAVQVRLLALEYLAEKRVEMDTLRDAIGQANMESDPAVLQHAIELTNQPLNQFD